MPPTGYLTADGIEASLQHLANTYSSICELLALPERSHEGRTIRAVRIAGRPGTTGRGMLFIGGVHAREIVNPDLLVSFALKLCQAYTSGTGLVFGGKSFSASIVEAIVDRLHIFVLPLVNPDGRVYVQSPTGEAFWRKNRNPNPGLSCRGVDINRNYDFLWPSGIGTNADACSDVFKGSNAFSEPETRNVRHLLDTYPYITGFVDVHSYSELVLFPWGDDNNQTTDPSMNFRNPAFNGLRGTAGDTVYREYIPQADSDWFVATGSKVRDAIAATRGRVYTLKQGVLLYPTSGTSKDYAYSRHLVNTAKRKVYSYLLETGTEFQPPYSEALNIISEVSAGLTEFCRILAPPKRPKEKDSKDVKDRKEALKDKEALKEKEQKDTKEKEKEKEQKDTKDKEKEKEKEQKDTKDKEKEKDKDRKDVKDRKEALKDKEALKEKETLKEEEAFTAQAAGGELGTGGDLAAILEQLMLRVDAIEQQLARGQAFITSEERPQLGEGTLAQSEELQPIGEPEQEEEDHS